MPGGGLAQGTPEEVVITGDALVKRCPVQEQRRGDVIEPEYGRMQVRYGVSLDLSVMKAWLLRVLIGSGGCQATGSGHRCALERCF